jgi:hypothetical protein
VVCRNCGADNTVLSILKLRQNSVDQHAMSDPEQSSMDPIPTEEFTGTDKPAVPSSLIRRKLLAVGPHSISGE